VNAPTVGTGQVAGAMSLYGFATPCEPAQVSWGLAASPGSSDAKTYQISGIIQAGITSDMVVGTVPSNTKFVSAWPVNGVSVDGTSFAPIFTDTNLGYMAVGGPAISANLVRVVQPTSPGVQHVAIDAADPVLALFASTNKPLAAGVTADAKVSFGAYDGLSQVAHWWGLTNGAPFPYQRARLSSVTQAILLASATGPSTSTLNAQAACTGLASQDVILNWTTVDATARDNWMLVFANDPGTGVCGTPVPPTPCGPAAPTIPAGTTASVGWGSAVAGADGSVVQ